MVIDDGEVVYVGETGHLRQRLRTHLRGNRGSSVLHKQVGEELDSTGTTIASADDIAGWLGERTLRWQVTEKRLALKAALVSRLNPRFNHQLRSDLPDRLAEPATPDGSLDPPEDSGPAEPAAGRRRRQAEVTVRQGQPDFRRDLMQAYDGRCAISGCDVEAALQAAHISPYDGPATNTVRNGLLLRADLHNLFDRGLLWIDDEFRVRLAGSVHSHYAEHYGRPLRLPTRPEHRPDRAALRLHQVTIAKVPSAR
ncbi:HNH endonuclease [Plantactinospora mayteni]|uniref:HNH endonuclease n=1 Tax=Plantactinospora mayteni TaxID=566021 RepID=UPI001941569B|nr:HNH endonuclease [Plantactinospora mayteni]